MFKHKEAKYFLYSDSFIKSAICLCLQNNQKRSKIILPSVTENLIWLITDVEWVNTESTLGFNTCHDVKDGQLGRGSAELHLISSEP